MAWRKRFWTPGSTGAESGRADGEGERGAGEESRQDETSSAIAMASYQAPQDLSPKLPEDFTAIDVTAFMNRVYALASQI